MFTAHYPLQTVSRRLVLSPLGGGKEDKDNGGGGG